MASDRKRMFQLGEWLEIYLDSSSTHLDYKKLAKLFIDYYNIDFRLRNNDFTLDFISMLAEQNEAVSLQYSDRKLREKIFDYDFPGFYEYTEDVDPLNINGFIKDIRDKVFYTHGMNVGPEGMVCSSRLCEDWEYKAFDMIFHIFDSKALIKVLLHEIYAIKDSYVEIFNEWLDQGDFLLFDLFWASYGAAATSLIVKNGSLSVRSILTEGFSSDIQLIPSIFPWMAASSFVFFDFFFRGGQKHFKFCEHCGKFTIIKRKGKRFCSDICRTEFNRVSA